MLLLLLALIAQAPAQGLIFENSREDHFSHGPAGITLRAGRGWLRVPGVKLDFELAFEYQLDGEDADAGVVVRSWASGREWPDAGYRIRLPATGRPFEGALLTGRRASVQTIREASATVSPGEWRRIRIKAERQRISVMLDGVDGGEYDVASTGGHIIFDVGKGALRFRNISIREIESPTDDAAPAVPVASADPALRVSLPEVLSETRPMYPRELQKKRIEGVVELVAVVLPDGRVGSTTVVKALDPDLDRAAIAAVRQWRFTPGRKGDTPIPMRVVIELTFRLSR